MQIEILFKISFFKPLKNLSLGSSINYVSMAEGDRGIQDAHGCSCGGGGPFQDAHVSTFEKSLHNLSIYNLFANQQKTNDDFTI